MIYGGYCVDQIINAASIYFDRIYSHTPPLEHESGRNFEEVATRLVTKVYGD